ncbi:MAG: hypothetical protein HGA45_41565, partial [Chloroflexales bacterium]|nr:hypothetical protein [Chloroflexales bacterium]
RADLCGAPDVRQRPAGGSRELSYERSSARDLRAWSASLGLDARVIGTVALALEYVLTVERVCYP